VFGINGSEFIVLLAVAAVVLGPERLPRYAQQLAQLIRELRTMAASAQDKVREEMGPEFEDIDWRALDPRQYDPRRIVREALTDVVDTRDPLGIKDFSLRPSVTPATPESAVHDEPDAGPEPAFDPDAT